MSGGVAPGPGAPLRGVRVVEHDSFVAGPSAGLALSQLGADVIRIDPLRGGADFRRWPLDARGESLFWASLNRNKRSVALDLRSPEGQELAVALITAPDSAAGGGGTAGVFVDNSVGRGFLAPEALRERRADLLHVRIQGRADGRAGVDYTINAESGVPGISGPEGWGEPVNSVIPAWDLVAGMATVTSVTTGLYRRAATGEGGLFELALEDIALSTVANMGWLTDVARGGTRTALGNHIYGTFGTDFATADGARVMIAALTPRQWKVLTAATATEEAFGALERTLGLDLSAESDRFTHRALLTEVLRPWFAARTLDAVAESLDAHGVLWSRYKSLGEVAGEIREGAHAGLFGADGARAAAGEPTLSPASPIRIDGAYSEVGEPVRLGVHTEEVLSEVLGLGDAELSGLAEREVIRRG